MCRYGAVEEDCNTALALQEDYVKAYLRRGVARRHLGKYKEAIHGTIHTDRLNSVPILYLWFYFSPFILLPVTQILSKF